MAWIKNMVLKAAGRRLPKPPVGKVVEVLVELILYALTKARERRERRKEEGKS